VFMNCCQGTDANSIGNLAKGGGGAIGLDILADEFENLFLAFVDD